MRFEIGKTYHVDGEISLCKNGLHFCERLIDVLDFYSNNDGNRFFEVDVDGLIKTDGKKSVTSTLTVIREINDVELNRVIYSAGDDYGYGYGDGGLCGEGNGDGYGYGYGYGYGDLNGYGYGYGYGYGDGHGHGYDGNGYGDDDSYNYGEGHGDGHGDGYGSIQEIIKYV